VTRASRRRLARLPPLAAALALAFVSPFVAAGKPPAQANDQFIVKFRDGSVEHDSAARRQQRLDAIGTERGLRIGQLRRLAVGADVIHTDRKLDAIATRALIARLRADPRVEYAEVDLRVQAQSLPNDPGYASQWSFFEPTAGINAPAAWTTTTGAGQVVAVLDTGITSHSDLAANLVAGYDFISNPVLAVDGGGRDSDPSDPGDWFAAGECSYYPARNSSWHGTEVAGTIAALTNNGVGVAGVAYGAKVQPIRVLGKCGGDLSDLEDAIVWAAGGSVAGVADNPTPAKVLNLSVDAFNFNYACPASMQAAVDTAVALGATVVAAAGNLEGYSLYDVPADCRNVLAVTALDRAGDRAHQANTGPDIDLAAPGGDSTNAVLSTSNAGTTTPGAEAYAGYSGTSAAAPHVSATVALARAASGNTLSPAWLTALLQGTSRAIPGTCDQCGIGLLDAGAAVAAAPTSLLAISDPAPTNEGDAGTLALSFTVSLSKPIATDVTFSIATLGDTATVGSDFVGMAATGQVIPAGATSKTFTVLVNGDTAFEFNEAFSIVAYNVVGDVTVVDPVGKGVILNDDIGTLVNDVDVTGVADPQPDHLMTWRLDVPAGAYDLEIQMWGAGDADLLLRYGAPYTVWWEGYDYGALQPGATETISVPDWDAREGAWYVTVWARSPYDQLSLRAHYYTPAGISIDDASVVEGDSGTRDMVFTVRLTHALPTAVNYKITTANITAAAGSDYYAFNLLDEWIYAGETSKQYVVAVRGDTVVEPNESMAIGLTKVTGAYVIDDQAVGSIVNDDGPLLSIDDASITEGNSGTKLLNFVVRLSKAANVPVTYTVATADGTAIAGTDYVATTLTGQTLPAGQLARAFSVPINGDTAVEGNENFKANLSAGSVNITDAQANGIILNDDGPTLSINDAGYQEGNSGTKAMTFTVSLSQASATPVTFNIASSGGTATAGVDYTGINYIGQSIPAGQLSKTFQVTTQGDTTVEGNENFFLTLTGASVTVTDQQGRGSIINDDGPVLSIGDASVTEGNSGTKTLAFVVSLSKAAPAPVTYTVLTNGGTATAGSDYVASNHTDTIPAGQLSKTFNVTINGDTTVEPNETINASLQLGNVSILDGAAVGILTNDD
jgi:serine protease